MPTGARRDPYFGNKFTLEVDGIARAAFRECSGLDSTSAAVDYREGTDGRATRKLPGHPTWSNIVLKWGMTDDATLYDWHKAAADGAVERKNGSIVLLDETGSEKRRWNFREGWPTKWSAEAFNATANEVAIETLEIVHEGLVKA